MNTSFKVSLLVATLFMGQAFAADPITREDQNPTITRAAATSYSKSACYGTLYSVALSANHVRCRLFK